MPYPTQDEIVQFFTGPLDTSTDQPLGYALKIAIDDYTGHLAGATNLASALALIDTLQAGGQGVFVGFSADNADWHAPPQAGDAYMRFASGTARPVETDPSWSTGIQFVGPQGIRGPFPVYQYQNAASIPPDPTGGSYDLGTDVQIPSPGWSLQISAPGVGENTYFVQDRIDPATQSGVVTMSWSPVLEAGGTGPPGSPGVTLSELFAALLSGSGIEFDDSVLNERRIAVGAAIARLDSPVFSGAPTVPTAPQGDDSLSAVNTEWAQREISGLVDTVAVAGATLEVTDRDGVSRSYTLPGSSGVAGGTGDLQIEELLNRLTTLTLPANHVWIGTTLSLPDSIQVLLMDASDATDDYEVVDWAAVKVLPAGVAGQVSAPGSFHTFQATIQDIIYEIRIGHTATNEILLAANRVAALGLPELRVDRMLAPIASAGLGHVDTSILSLNATDQLVLTLEMTGGLADVVSAPLTLPSGVDNYVDTVALSLNASAELVLTLGRTGSLADVVSAPLALPAASIVTDTAFGGDGTPGDILTLAVAGADFPTIPIVKGGTGAATAADARTALGLGSAAVANVGIAEGEIPVLATGGVLATTILAPAGDEMDVMTRTSAGMEWAAAQNGYVDTAAMALNASNELVLTLGRTGALVDIVTVPLVLPATGLSSIVTDTAFGGDGSMGARLTMDESGADFPVIPLAKGGLGAAHADVAAVRATLGLGTAALLAAGITAGDVPVLAVGGVLASTLLAPAGTALQVLTRTVNGQEWADAAAAMDDVVDTAALSLNASNQLVLSLGRTGSLADVVSAPLALPTGGLSAVATSNAFGGNGTSGSPLTLDTGGSAFPIIPIAKGGTGADSASAALAALGADAAFNSASWIGPARELVFTRLGGGTPATVPLGEIPRFRGVSGDTFIASETFEFGDSAVIGNVLHLYTDRLSNPFSPTTLPNSDAFARLAVLDPDGRLVAAQLAATGTPGQVLFLTADGREWQDLPSGVVDTNDYATGAVFNLNGNSLTLRLTGTSGFSAVDSNAADLSALAVNNFVDSAALSLNPSNELVLTLGRDGLDELVTTPLTLPAGGLSSVNATNAFSGAGTAGSPLGMNVGGSTFPTIPIDKGGTGAENAADARIALGLGSVAVLATGILAGQVPTLGPGGVWDSTLLAPDGILNQVLTRTANGQAWANVSQMGVDTNDYVDSAALSLNASNELTLTLGRTGSLTDVVSAALMLPAGTAASLERTGAMPQVLSGNIDWNTVTDAGFFTVATGSTQTNTPAGTTLGACHVFSSQTFLVQIGWTYETAARTFTRTRPGPAGTAFDPWERIHIPIDAIVTLLEGRTGDDRLLVNALRGILPVDMLPPEAMLDSEFTADAVLGLLDLASLPGLPNYAAGDLFLAVDVNDNNALKSVTYASLTSALLSGVRDFARESSTDLVPENRISEQMARLANPTFEGDVRVPTPADGSNSTRVPTTGWVRGRIADLAPNEYVDSAGLSLDVSGDLVLTLGRTGALTDVVSSPLTLPGGGSPGARREILPFTAVTPNSAIQGFTLNVSLADVPQDSYLEVDLRTVNGIIFGDKKHLRDFRAGPPVTAGQSTPALGVYGFRGIRGEDISSLGSNAALGVYYGWIDDNTIGIASSNQNDDPFDFVRVVITPITGVQGAQGLLEFEIFQNSSLLPATPTGGPIDVEAGTVNPPNNWSTDRTTPGPGETTYASRTSVNPLLQTGIVTPVWSAPYLAGGIGPIGVGVSVVVASSTTQNSPVIQGGSPRFRMNVITPGNVEPVDGQYLRFNFTGPFDNQHSNGFYSFVTYPVHFWLNNDDATELPFRYPSGRFVRGDDFPAGIDAYALKTPDAYVWLNGIDFLGDVEKEDAAADVEDTDAIAFLRRGIGQQPTRLLPVADLRTVVDRGLSYLDRELSNLELDTYALRETAKVALSAQPPTKDLPFGEGELVGTIFDGFRTVAAGTGFQGALWVITVGGNATYLNRVNTYDPTDETGPYGDIGELPAGIDDPMSLIALGNRLYVVNGNDTNAGLWRINPNDPDDTSSPYGRVGSFTVGLNNPRGGFATLDGAMYVFEAGSPDEIWRVDPADPDGGVSGLLGSLPTAIDGAPTGGTWHDGYAYAASGRGRAVWRISLTGGTFNGDTSTSELHGRVGMMPIPDGANITALASLGGLLYVMNATQLWAVSVGQIEAFRAAHLTVQDSGTEEIEGSGLILNFAQGLSVDVTGNVATINGTGSGGGSPPTHALYVGWSGGVTPVAADFTANSDTHTVIIPDATGSQYLVIWRSDLDGGDPTSVTINGGRNVRNTFGAATAFELNGVAGQVIVSVTTQNANFLSQETLGVS